MRLLTPYSRRLTDPFGIDVNVTTDINPPSTFHFPTDGQYTQALAGSINNIISLGGSQLVNIISPPANSSVHSLVTLVENVTGTSLVNIIAGQMLPGAPAIVTSMMTNLLNNALDVVIAGVEKAISDIIGDIVGVVPVLGQIVGAVIGLITDIANAAKGVGIDPAAEENAQKIAQQRFQTCVETICSAQNANLCRDVRETGYSPQLGVHRSIADTFRPFAYALHEAKAAPNGAVKLPFCGILFPIAALCGAESLGVIWKNRGEYDNFVASMRVKYNDSKLGIPQEAQRRMWSLFTSICKCVNDPRMSASQAPIGDGGRSLFPLLTDLTWAFCNDNSGRKNWLKTNMPGHWTVPFLKDMMALHSPTCSANANQAGVSYFMSGRCSDYIDVVGDWYINNGVIKLFSDYDIQLKNGFGAVGGGLSPTVTNKLIKSSLKLTQKKGVVVLHPATGRSTGEIVALTAAAAGGSYLAWEIVRRLVKKHK